MIPKNIPTNIFTIFLPVVLVALILLIWYFTKGYSDKNGSILSESNNSFSRRNLNASIEQWDMDKIDNYKPLQQDLDNIHKDSEGFVKFLKQQRFTFFSKVEDDYLKDPENETLQIFKNEKESIFDLENGTIQKRLVSENLTEKKQPKTIDDFIDTKNQKYKNIESLFWETSTMFSEDLHFAYDDEVNFLHIMLKLKGIDVVNSQL